MPIVTLHLPVVKSKREERPKHCPYCEGETFQRWGQVSKRVKDGKRRKVRVYRYRCCRCGRTFRHYPEGVTKADQTERLKALAAICWQLGLSTRGVETILGLQECALSHMSVWRDAQEQAGELGKRNQWGKVRVLGVDGAYVRGWGGTQGVLVAVDLGTGQPVALGYADEKDPAVVRRWLEPLVQRLGVSVIVTDDLHSYRVVARQLQLGHQVCQFHVRRWVGREMRELREGVPKDWLWMLDDLEQILAELPQDGARRLYGMWKYLPGQTTKRTQTRSPLERLRDLLLRLSEHWESYCLFYGEPDIPWTNNATEQVIGRMKMRARTVRGYKTWQGMHNGLLLSGTRLG